MSKRWNVRALRALAALGVAAGVLAVSSVQAQIVKLPGPIIVRPVLPGPEDFVEISAGGDQTCARKFGGKTYCWGRNELRQLGIERAVKCNAVDCLPQPELLMNSLQVAVGTYHGCAIDTARNARCWGLNVDAVDGHGQAGTGTGNSVEPVPALVAGTLVFNQIATGRFGSCGATTQGVFCWGNIINSSALSEKELEAPPTREARPVLHIPNTDFRSVAVGNSHVCARWRLSVNGQTQAFCWGDDSLGQGGLDPALFAAPDFNIHVLPPAFQSTLGTDINAVATGGEFSCAEKTNGSVVCTGANSRGQLGAGDTRATGFAARLVGRGMALRGVAAGQDHACALDAGGRAFCWGSGDRGQLGNGAWLDSSTPVAVAGGRSYRAIAAGHNHTCAIGTDNHLYCWGQNNYGQLGLRGADPASTVYSVPWRAADPMQ